MNAPAVKKSTIVRTFRAAFFMLERFAPQTGSRLAERLWCKIPQGRIQPFTTPGDVFTIGVNGRAVVGESWGDGPAVYLMHGWGGWRGQFDAFVEPLVKAGHRVIALDAPSHGDSAPGAFGKGQGLLSEFSDALFAATAQIAPAYAVIGHSLGGTAAAIAVLDGLETQHLVTISAASDPVSYTQAFAKTLGFGERIRTGFLRLLEERVKRPMAHFDVVMRARTRDELPSLLVIHDDQDKQTRFADAGAIAQAWPGAVLHPTSGLGHVRILKDQSVVDLATADRRIRL